MVAFLLSAVIAGALTPVSEGSAQTVTVDYRDTGYYVSVTSADNITLSVDATPVGQIAISSVSIVNVKTNAPLGYKLYLSTEDDELKATDSSITQTFKPVTSTSLTNNTWGFSKTGADNSWLAVPEVTSGNESSGYLLSSADAPNIPDGDDIEIYYGINSNTTMPSGTYTTTVTYTAIGEGIPPEQKTMQDFTVTDCANMDTDTTTELVDTRNEKTYNIVKARDGNCWMADNLELYSTDANTITLTPSDTDIKSGTFTVPKSTNWSGNQYTSALLHVADGTGQYADKTGAYNGEVYYNWCAALAKGSCAESSGTIDQSICPKGWRLPINGDANTDKSWAKLMNAYSITTGAQLLAQANLGFYKYYGVWSWNHVSEFTQGAYGYFWSSTAYSGPNAYNLDYNSTGINPQNNYNKGHGFSVRCVLR